MTTKDMTAKDITPKEKLKTGISIHISLQTMGIEAFIVNKNLGKSSKSRILNQLQLEGKEKNIQLNMKDWEEILTHIN